MSTAVVRFPIDRSLRADNGWLSDAVDCRAIDFGGRDRAHAVAFAALFVFSRISGQTSLQLCPGPQASLHDCFAMDFDPGATLGQAFRDMQVKAETGHGAVLDLVLDERMGTFGPPPDDRRPRLAWGQGPEGLKLSLCFDSGAIAPVSARDFLEKICLVLHALAESPDRKCDEIALIGKTASGLIPDLSKPIPGCPQESAARSFFEIARQHGEKAAVVGDAHVYSYDDLSGVTRLLGGKLRAAGLRPGDVVAVRGVNSFGMIAAILAVIATGGVLVTIDQTLPETRQALIERISCPRFLIRVGDREEPTGASNTFFTPDWPSRQTLQQLLAGSPPVEEVLFTPEDDSSAYIFFTSGSTGEPKGVLGTHRGLSHFLTWQRGAFPLGPGDRAAQLTAMSFDVVLRDILFPLTSGACLHVPPRELLLDPRRMLKWFHDNAITSMHVVPSLMKAWLQSRVDGRPFASLRYAFFAGEPLTDTLLSRFRDLASDRTRLINLYGPTETTLAKLFNCVDAVEPGVQPVGNAQPGADVVVLHDRRRLCGLWETGEIAIRTPYRSKGYLANDDLTQAVFRPNALSEDPDDLIYMTGDLGRVRSDGKIEIFGRMDSQIKIRGVRIEPTEIEDLLLRQGGVRDAAIATRVDANDNKILLALVVAEAPLPPQEEGAQANRLREALRAELHPAMVPARFVFVESLPYLPNGKINRKAISALDLDTQENKRDRRAALGESTKEERALVAGLEGILNTPIDDLTKSFVEMGGDSLSHIQASLVVEDVLGWLPDGWDRISFSDLASRRKSGRSRLTKVNTTVILRVLAIVAVVLVHTGALRVGGGTFVLLLLTGHSVSRYQAVNLLNGKILRFYTAMLSKLLIPYYVIISGLALWFTPFDWQWFALINNWWPVEPEMAFPYWFVSAYAQIIVILGLVFAIPGVAHAFRTWPKASAYAGLAAATVVMRVLGMDAMEFGPRSHSPIAALQLLMVGWCIASVEDIRDKFVASIVVAGVFLLDWSDLDMTTSAWLYAGTAMIIWIRTVPLPRVVALVMLRFSALSLYIYLFHVPAIYLVFYFVESNLAAFFGVFTLCVLGALVAGELDKTVGRAIMSRFLQVREDLSFRRMRP